MRKKILKARIWFIHVRLGWLMRRRERLTARLIRLREKLDTLR